MGDINTISSRYRIVYTPKDGDEITLLEPGDEMDNELALRGGPQVTTTALLARQWMHHAAAGNAEATLTFDVHRRAPSPAAAQALGMTMWRRLTTHADGEIHLETAFVSDKSCPMIDWRLRATCNSVAHEEVNIDTSPYAKANSCHLSYEFTVSLNDAEED